MRVSLALTGLSLALLPFTRGARVLIGNDDGFGTANIRALYAAVRAAGHEALIAAPVQQQSGTDGTMKDPTPLEREGEFGLVPKGAPAEGHDAADDHIWYINSTPASSIKYGLDVLAPRYFGGPPDVVLTGPNQGSNLGLAYLVSGTYGAAKYAVAQGVPGIALSAQNATVRPYTELGGPEDQANIYAAQAVQLLGQLLKSSPPLPRGTGLNVNFPSAPQRGCTASNSRWIVSRLLGNVQRSPDACTCGDTSAASGCKLPVERNVLDKKHGCSNSISGFAPTTWSPDTSAQQQQVVIESLQGFTSCLA